LATASPTSARTIVDLARDLAPAPSDPSFAYASLSPAGDTESLEGYSVTPQGWAGAMSRMFDSMIGQKSVNIVGNESRTLAFLGEIATELVADQIGAEKSDRYEVLVVLPGIAPFAGPPTLLVLDREYGMEEEPKRLTDRLELGSPDRMFEASHATLDSYARGMASQSEAVPPFREVAGLITMLGPRALAETLWIAQPEVILARHPRMIPMTCPSPALEVIDATGESSSVGMFCRDASGVAGITACFHGTGPAGTPVMVGGLPSAVTLASEVQDLVFIPLPQGYVVPNFARGTGGVRSDRPPFEGERGDFEGCTSGARQTVVSSHDKGLMRLQKSLQLRVQTPPQINKGDSGSALIDEDDRVMAFAFERTDYGEPIEFANWIWAANAMAALGLQKL
jgi:hypothetical protein